MANETVKGATPVAAAPARKTLTNWKVFEEGNFIPVQVKCNGYLGSHPSDMACHSNVKPNPEDVLRHMDPAHGGGWFMIKFRISDGGKKSDLWAGLEQAGVECQHFYCPHCREEVPVSPRAIVKHLQPHAGANRSNMYPQTLCMTLGFQRADAAEYDDLYSLD